MRLRVIASLLSIFLIVPPSIAAAASASPLDTLCKRICGGVWRTTDSGKTYFRRYEYDARYGVIKGRSGVSADTASASDTLTLFGYDTKSKTIWAIKASAGEMPFQGEARIADDGYNVAWPTSIGIFFEETTFEGRDTLTETSRGEGVYGAPVTWRRSAE